MLALLGFLGLSDIHAMNGLKNFFNLCINVVAAGYFILKGAVSWPEALILAVGAAAGGYGGARFSRYIGQEKARAAVVAIGLLVTVLLAWQHAIVRPGDLSRLDAAFFTANGLLAVWLFAAIAADLVHGAAALG